MGLMEPMGLMRVMRPMGLMGLIVLMGLVGLMGCSDDPETKKGEWVTVEATPCSTGFMEVDKGSTTRAWTPPEDYVLYSTIFDTNGMFKEQKDLANKTIKVFFTQGTEDKQERQVYYKESELKWKLNTELENVTSSSPPLQLYGFIPIEDADGADVSPLYGNYSNGAVLTINGLSTVTVSDVCVIIGAKNGRGEEDDTGETVTPGVSDGIRVAPGLFDIKFDNSGLEEAKNHIFLLFDHIYTSLRFAFTIDPTYNALRTIRLTALELIAYSNESGGGIKAKYNATITLKKNTTGDSPIVGDIVFTPTGSTDVGFTPLYERNEMSNDLDTDNDVILNPDKPTNFMGCFVPGVNTFFKLRSTYDVFDKQGHLIREGCQAENAIDLRKKFTISGTMHGQCYTYKIMVQPTYLYMLSEPDVDNPTGVVN